MGEAGQQEDQQDSFHKHNQDMSETKGERKYVYGNVEYTSVRGTAVRVFGMYRSAAGAGVLPKGDRKSVV